MKKIAFIGAGSFGFTRSLVRDILSFPALSDCTIALMDIDPDRLAYIKRAVEKIIAAGNYPAKIEATMDRAKALEGADGVLCTILQGGVNVWRHDVEIPKKYGVDINVGDTRGPAGIFRALRTIPVMLGIARDIEKYCPDAIFLNYTNPMAMLCRAMQEQSPKVRISGLCHSVQGTAEILAKFIGADPSEISYTCAGINHQAFYLKFMRNGRDVIPEIRKAVLNNPEVSNEEPVRNDMFLNLGYYPTESSGHNSEYNAWFRKRPELIEKYCTHGTGWNPGIHRAILDEYLEREGTWEQEFKKELAEPFDLNRGGEYASNIFNAIFGDNTPYEFNGNVRNFGLISNLPEGACVEVPVLASKAGIRPFSVGKLPDNLAILINTSSRCEELAIDAAIDGDAWKVFQAVLFDPLTSAVLSMDETRQMVREMLLKNSEYLTYFKSLDI